MILQEAIRQREEATLSNEVDIRSSNKQFVSTRLQQQYGNEWIERMWREWEKGIGRIGSMDDWRIIDRIGMNVK